MAAFNRRSFFRASSAAGFACMAQPFRLMAQGESAVMPIQDRERIVFLGDSITQGGQYVAYLETLMRLRSPGKSFEVHNHGISSETISGTSEPDHDPRRPWAHERFSRDLADWRPTLVFSCFGMNDGNYHPFDQERFEKYQAGIHRLIERVEKEAGTKRLVISTPPPFDAYQRGNGDKKAQSYGYKYPAINYDDTLGRYSDWLLTLKDKGQTVIDLHGPINRHMANRRKQRVSFTLMPDAVHPNSTGHAVMAITMAKALGLNTSRDELMLNDGKLKLPLVAKHGQAELQSVDSNQAVILWKVPSAWSFGADVDAESLALEGLDTQFNRLILKMQSPKPGTYRLEIQDGEKSPVIKTVSSDELAKGVNVDPTDRAAGQALSEAVMKHRQASSNEWRNRAMKLPRNDERRGPQLEELALEAEAAAKLSAQASKLSGPIKLTIKRQDG